MGQGEVKEVVLDELRAYRHCGELRLHFKLQDFKQIKDHIFRREFCPVLSPLAHIWASAVAHGKESACSAGDTPLQYSCLKNPMDRGAWWSTVHGVTKSQI